MRKFSEEEIDMAMQYLSSKGDLFYRDILKSILFPDPDMINPPAAFAFYLLNSEFVRKNVTTDFIMLRGAIFRRIRLNESRYINELEILNERLKGTLND